MCPVRWHDYIWEEHAAIGRDGRLWGAFPPVIPFSIVDERIVDLAMQFRDDADTALSIGYRRLEDLLRRRTGSDAHGERLLRLAFGREAGRLAWKGASDNESEGRLQLFTGAFKACRNPRAHKERGDVSREQLPEFLLLNQLFRLESQATERPAG